MNKQHALIPKLEKTYTPPQLVVYGAVSKMTAGGSGVMGETAWMSDMCPGPNLNRVKC